MGRPRKNANPEATNKTSIPVQQRDEMNESQKVMNRVYVMMTDPATKMVDIMSYIQSAISFNPSLSDTFGTITDDMVQEVKQNNSFNIDDIGESKADKDGLFKVIDVKKMDKATKQSILSCPSYEEARGLMDIYYQTQAKRIVIENQVRAMNQGTDSELKTSDGVNNRRFMEWYLANTITMENAIKDALAAFSDSNYLCKWAKANLGIGPVIATCLTSNLQYTEGMHVGSWWSYCGLNDNNRPWLGRTKSTEIFDNLLKEYGGISDDFVMAYSNATQWPYEHFRKMAYDENTGKWKKDKLISAASIIPYNKQMKVLMYKIGHSFLMCKNKEGSLYGRILNERMQFENMMNEKGAYAKQAEDILKTKNFKPSTNAYKSYSQGKLPPAHISQRCQRYATKLFISHLFEANYYNIHGTMPPDPYIFAYGDPITGEKHTDYIPPEVPYTSIDRDVECAKKNPTSMETYNAMLAKGQ